MLSACSHLHKCFVSHVGILLLDDENFDFLALWLWSWFLQGKHQGHDTSGIFGHFFSQVWILYFTQLPWWLLTSFLPVSMIGSWYHISLILSALKKHRLRDTSLLQGGIGRYRYKHNFVTTGPCRKVKQGSEVHSSTSYNCVFEIFLE